jgi:hypothetical protein
MDMMDSEQAAQDIARQTAERFERVDRYLERVAALSATDWGRLDAAGQRFNARDLLARWRRARRFAGDGILPLAFHEAMAVAFFTADILKSAVDGRDGEEAPTGWLTSLDAAAQPRSPEGDRMIAQIRRLHEIAAAQPGGPGAALSCLGAGLVALHITHTLSTDPRTSLYSIVEPVIPLASL